MLFALVAADTPFAVDLYPTRALAEAALRTVLRDEPGFADLLSVEEVEADASEPSPN